MSTERSSLTNPQLRLPELSLPSGPGGATRPVTARGRHAPVLVLVHGAGCAGCRDYVDRLAAERNEIAEWDGSVGVVGPEPVAGAGALSGGGAFRVLSDPAGKLAAALGMGPPALVVADQWGQIHLAHEAGEDHRFPPASEVVSWLRYLAVRCPECEGEAL